MKTLLLAIVLTLITCNPVAAWTDEYNEMIRRADEQNYQNNVIATQQRLINIEIMHNHERMRERMDRDYLDSFDRIYDY